MENPDNKMPKIQQHNVIDISPEKFLGQCSPAEIYETSLLLQTSRYETVIRSVENGGVEVRSQDTPIHWDIHKKPVKHLT